MKINFLIIFILAFMATPAQTTVGLINYKTGNADAYLLFSPIISTNTYLIDKCGRKVHEWNTSKYRPALASYLLEDGSIMRTGILNNLNFDEGGSVG
ncbi:MAG: hypothetical protein SGJ00_12865 [bacterium]|nr:hypothetical protein [bacterium]